MYRWVDHTAEVELEIRAPTEREVFADAVAALAELLAVERQGTEERRIAVNAPDRPALLVAWLEELVFLAESEGFEPVGLESITIEGNALQAVVSGRLGDPPPLVKAVTYHGLSFEPCGSAYCATVVLDV